MNTNDLNNAVAEAKRFIKAAKSCEELYKGEIHPGREAAACKRASMDLSSALVDLRHPYRKGAK